ncbi:hypothetical protein BJX68DRAFT_247254 [Aspergillus pseudodeflectus]|uniref:Plastocyanin-like domain-containing protein n=1 Tax=Aspergillus pseudodeflectus TaxID=176178 RepID=A0ABR4JJ58_9EURO
MTDISGAIATDFARSIPPIYHGPCVTIRINSCDHEYTVSKDLLFSTNNVELPLINVEDSGQITTTTTSRDIIIHMQQSVRPYP